MTDEENTSQNQGSWEVRRQFMFATVFFCMCVVTYILYAELDSATAQTAMNMAFFTIMSTVSSYVFGAVWDDKAMSKGIKK